ncbi:hypothetical protein [Actinopolyspora sp. H202]|uniref:hypothetical protein n=1 Tax=Actinopolyspora sp. H202 TaxID=1500456 RepID=UPI003F49D117
MLSVAPEPPLGAIGVEQVGKILLTPPLLQVMAAERLWVDGAPRLFNLNVSGNHTIDADRIVRTYTTVRVADLVVRDHSQAELTTEASKKRLYRRADGGLAITGTRKFVFAR